MVIEFNNVEEAISDGRSLQSVSQKLLELNDRLTNIVNKIDASWASNTEDKTTYIEALRKVIQGLGYANGTGLVPTLNATGRTCELYATNIRNQGNN